jgi:NitT/TauT family transport system substrate-binding protein
MANLTHRFPAYLRAATSFLLLLSAACAPAGPAAPTQEPASKRTQPAAAPAAPTVPAAAPAEKPTGPRDRLKLPTVVSYELNLPALVAYANDYFGEENIEIEDFVLGSGGTLRNALIAKEHDFGLFAFVHVPLARLANSPWKMVIATHEREIFSLVVRNELQDQVKQVADLKGKRVGFSTPGAGSWEFASLYLKKAGLNPETDLEFVSLGGDVGVIYAALQTGKVDAFASWEPTTSRALSTGVAYPLIAIWQEEDHRQWVGSDKALGFGLVTREDVIESKPDLVRRMVNAHKKGLNYIRANNAATIAETVLGNPKTKQQFEGLDNTLVVDIIERIKPGFGDGCLSRSAFQTEMDLAVEYDLVKAPITFEEFADPTWAGACP